MDNIERKIVIGLVTSTEYIQQIEPVLNLRLFEGPVMRRLASWCMEYYEKYKKAPDKNIQTIYLTKAKDLPIELAEDIEEEILPNLSEEFDEDGFNLDYMVEKTFEYFKQRNLQLFSEEIQGLLEDGQMLEAEKLAGEYKSLAIDDEITLDLSHEVTQTRVERAFTRVFESVITYPDPLGKLWNQQLRKGGFVALMASEKKGKTFRLLDMSMHGYKHNKSKVAFFQAGDMTEDEQLIRIAVYLLQRSNNEEYCLQHFEPVRDCLLNQIDECELDQRECDFGIFDGMQERRVREDITLSDLEEAFRNNKDYRSCTNCSKYEQQSGLGVAWIRRVGKVRPITTEEAKKAYEEFFNTNQSFKLSSYANGTLRVSDIRNQLDIWERQDGFIPDIITIDYADILVPEAKTEFRHQQNEIWKSLRGLSQERHALVLTATQADAASYEKDRLTMSNFSEDKRKYAHVTAMYGLNQDKSGREKEIGLMRINTIVRRDGDFNSTREVTVLQNLRKGRPFLGSFW